MSLSIEVGFATIHSKLVKSGQEQKPELVHINEFLQNCVRDTNVLKAIRDTKNMKKGHFINIE